MPAQLDLRLLVPAAVGWVAVLVLLPLPPWFGALCCASFACLALVLVRLPTATTCRVTQRGARRRTFALVFATVGLLAGATAAHQSTRQVGLVDELAAQRATVSLTATVASDPRVVARGQRPGGRDSTLVVVRLRVHEVQGRGRVSGSGARVLVFADEAWLRLQWGQRITVVGRLTPGERGADVTAVLRPRRGATVLRPSPSLLRGVESVRADTRTATDGLPADPRGLLPALVMGDTARLPAPLVDDMRATGMTHLTAVSGANVTILLMAVLWVCGWCRIPRRWRLWVCLTALGLFVLLCRPDPSVIRAAAMGVVGLLATSSGRPRAAAPALGTAVVVLLVVDPWLAASYGFALSVLATLGLLLFARPWGAAIAARLPQRWSWFGEALAVPIAVQATCAPVVVLLQGNVPLVGVLANLLAAPLVAPATLGGIAVVLLAPLSHAVAGAIAWGAALPTWLIAAIAHAAARVPFGVLPWPDGPPGAALLAALVIGLLLTGPRLVAASLRQPLVVGAVAVLLAAAAWPLPRPGWPPPGWVMVLCDVGQGDAAVLRTGPGRAVVVDAGPEPAAVDRCLRDLGIQTIDAVVLTHFHADHVAGLPGVLHERRATQIITTFVHADAQPDRDEPQLEPVVVRTAAAARVPVTEVRAGDHLHWPGIQARVLWPGRVIRAGSEQNNASVVLDVRSGGLRLLLLGDAEREAQGQVRRALLNAPGDQPVDVVKIAHHGSANLDPQLLAQVRAPFALISVGDNDYGHPSPTALRAAAESGAVVRRTDRDGDVAVLRKYGVPAVVTTGGRP